ncbi:MAG TPA: M2 family metallopeptidase [Pyrinomonadaceae bacterium]
MFSLGGIVAAILARARPALQFLHTGEDKMDATAINGYYAPLKAWLDEQNKTPEAAAAANPW